MPRTHTWLNFEVTIDIVHESATSFGFDIIINHLMAHRVGTSRRVTCQISGCGNIPSKSIPKSVHSVHCFPGRVVVGQRGETEPVIKGFALLGKTFGGDLSPHSDSVTIAAVKAWAT